MTKMSLTKNLKILGVIVPSMLLTGCFETNRGVTIEMLTMDGTWTEMISVHGYYDNESAARDIVRGLQLVSQTDGTISRSYRIK